MIIAMHIVLFTHPTFLGSQSMPRFASMLSNGMKDRGHTVEVWAPKALFYKFPVPKSLKKWMGYIDQYMVFPAQVKKRVSSYAAETLFVFADQALGPWIPLVADRPHVIHAHDLLAQLSALGEISENPTSATGKKYQDYIRKGYSKGKYFISVSKKTRQDLHAMLGREPEVSEVVYNGLNQGFRSQNVVGARQKISSELKVDLTKGYLLHVGGNQWYKNREGVIQAYNAWRSETTAPLPLLLIGPSPSLKLQALHDASPYKDDIMLLSGKNDEFVKSAYCGASLFLFPSLAEGFGWPIAEAMASGCPVITTEEAPMTEVGGAAAYYIRRKLFNEDSHQWSKEVAQVIDQVLCLSSEDRNGVVKAGLDNARRFDTDMSLAQIEKIYQQVLTRKN